MGFEKLIAVSLGHLLKTDNGLLEFEKISSNFSCERNSDIEDFLKNKARYMQERDITRTYIVVKESEMLDMELFYIPLGYFTLSLKNLNFSNDVSKSKVKELTSNKFAGNGVGFLIGQFGKNDLRAVEVSGSDIMKLAFNEIHKAYDIVGGRFVFLDCLPTEKVINFYKREGFLELSILANDDGYLQMFSRLPVKKVSKDIVEKQLFTV